ncbi:hypothetical protein CNMCM5793_007448 [Aspergillus hiratsukae]|uniref:NADH-cytochrome b5 reductase n=1 Tax=Aspergillus hiratsukae TaxID=1194566 RepID=A0A8H6Q1K0_9EURO|nr:hypothetical protein CNMCM5793_007448 [Aspergillus hiratsukae]KAF7164094.1 hypothetical protein CNMCM6106_000752 [Aspergillus hiratsukae]
MFAQAAFRLSQPVRQTFRKYTTGAVKGSNVNSLAYGIGAAGVAVGLGIYSYTQQQVAYAEAPKQTKKVFTGGDQGFVGLKLGEVENLSHNTKRMRFEFADKEAVSGLEVASCLYTKYHPVGADKPVARPYTPVSDEEEPGYLDLIVKVYPNGAMSEHLHSMKVGDYLDFKGPILKYPWQLNKHEHIGLIAGGTGIAPMYQLIRAIFKNPDEKTKVTLVLGNVREEDILLRKELEELEKKYPQRFKAYFLLYKAPKGWLGGRGFVSKDLLKTVLPAPEEENIKLFVCGSPPLYQSVSGNKVSPFDQGELTGILKELGYTKDQVFKF